MSINILNYRDIDVNNIIFSNPEKVKGGSYISIPKYNDNAIYIQTPKLVNKGFTKTDQRCTMELELDNTHLNFYEFITNIDDFNIVNIQKNSLEWFKQAFPLDVVEEFYKSPVKMARSKKAPSLKVKVPLSRGNIDCSIYNNKNQLINHSQIKENSKVLTVLHFYGLRFLKQQVICEWVPIQIKIYDEVKELNEKYLIDDSLLSDNEETIDNEETLDNEKTLDNEDNQDNQDNEDNLDNEDNQDNLDDKDNLDDDEANLDNEDNLNTKDTQLNEDSLDIIENEKSNNLVEENIISIDYCNDLNLSDLDNLEEHSFNSQPNSQTLNDGIYDSEKIKYMEQTIIDKDNRIEVLENKIRELYKYMSSN